MTSPALARVLEWEAEVRAYDWQILIQHDGRFRTGAIGRTKTLTRSRERIAEALKELPNGVKAHAEVLLTNLYDPNWTQLIEVAARERDGLIGWIRI